MRRRRGWSVLAALAAVLSVAGGSAVARGPALRGVVEGYYGRPWSGPARRDVIRFLGAHGLTTFLYAPKNDEFHRARWREPYPGDELRDLRKTARVARRAGVRFIYGLSPGLDICYSCAEDGDALGAKLDQLRRAGVRRFALLLDDTPARLTDARDVAVHGGEDEAALARAQAALANRTARRLKGRGRARLELVVPTIYWGTECRPYLEELGRHLGSRMFPVDSHQQMSDLRAL